MRIVYCGRPYEGLYPAYTYSVVREIVNVGYVVGDCEGLEQIVTFEECEAME